MKGKTRRTSRGWLLAAALTFFCLQAFAADTVPKSLTVTEEPYASADMLANKYRPVLDYLTRNGMPASYLRAGSYSQYVRNAEKHEIDIAFASTGLASLLVNQYGYIPLLASEGTLNAVAFVASNSKIETLEDLHHATVLVPEPYDIVAELAKQLLTPADNPHNLQLQTMAKVDQIMLAVLSGKAQAGVSAEYDLELMNPDLRKRLRIIGRSRNVTAHYILLQPGIAPDQQQKLRELLLQFSASKEGEEYTKNFGTDAFTPVTDTHHQEMNAFRSFGNAISAAP